MKEALQDRQRVITEMMKCLELWRPHYFEAAQSSVFRTAFVFKDPDAQLRSLSLQRQETEELLNTATAAETKENTLEIVEMRQEAKEAHARETFYKENKADMDYLFSPKCDHLTASDLHRANNLLLRDAVAAKKAGVDTLLTDKQITHLAVAAQSDKTPQAELAKAPEVQNTVALTKPLQKYAAYTTGDKELETNPVKFETYAKDKPWLYKEFGLYVGQRSQELKDQGVIDKVISYDHKQIHNSYCAEHSKECSDLIPSTDAGSRENSLNSSNDLAATTSAAKLQQDKAQQPLPARDR